MSTKPFNSVGGYSVGDESVSNVILANGDITTTNLTTTGIANLGNVGNVVISGGNANYLLQTDGSGNLAWTAPAATLTVYESNANAGNISNTTSNVSGILFDRDSGFQVYDIGNSNVLISLGSTFKTWIVDGQPNLVAQGEDEVQFIAGNNLIITTSNTPNPPTQLYKYIRFDADVHYVSNGTSNIDIPTANGNINFSVGGNANVFTVTSTGIVSGGGSGGNITGANIISANIINAQSNLNVTGISNLGPNGNVIITGGSNGQYLQTDGSGNLTWVSIDLSSISNGNSNVSIPDANGNVNISAEGTANVFVVTGTGANLTGIANITGNIYGGSNLEISNNITSNSLSANTIEVGDIYSKRNSIAVTSNTVIDSFGVAEYRSAKYSIRASDDTGYQAVEVLLIHNDINSYITIYGSLSMTGNDLVTLSSTINGSNVELLATGVGANTLVNLIGLYVPD